MQNLPLKVLKNLYYSQKTTLYKSGALIDLGQKVNKCQHKYMSKY